MLGYPHENTRSKHTGASLVDATATDDFLGKCRREGQVMNTPEAQRVYRFEQKQLHERASRELADGGPFTLQRGGGQTNKVRALVKWLEAHDAPVDVDETLTEYVLVLK